MTKEVETKKLNLEDIGRYLEDKGYKVQKLEQPWRHVVGTVRYENEKLFLKLASTKEIGERTENEAYWDSRVNDNWKKFITTFGSPKVFDDGYYKDRYWFIASYVTGKPLAEVGKEVGMTDDDLLQAAKMAKEIIDLTPKILLPKDERHMKEMWKVGIAEKAREWSKNCKTDTKKLLQFIEKHAEAADVAVSHGDFVPWHIIKSKNKKYFLVDAEAALIGGLKFYDVAYFYHRVYTKLQRPDLAKMFLDRFKEIYSWTENDQVTFEPVLASRIMGGYFDAERDGVTSMELNQEMERDLVDK